MSLISELQRRSVFKVAAAYLVVGWLIVQAASIAFPTFEAPAWALRVFIFVVLLGFPLALVLAWVFDVTPEGLRVDPAPVGNKRMLAVAGVLAALAIGWYFRAALPGVGPTTGKTRLAVLPLSNFSPDPANAFFADGLHDDMLTALSRLQGVEVVSRTTMQTFRDSKLTLAEIASKIGATQVLEGSVRRDATRVRLTVQLIDASTDDHLWAETYDRPLTDALTLQNEVAQGVAKAMKVALGEGAADAPLTLVPAAYDLYLKARLTTAYPDQLKLLDSALLLDPNFAQARAARAIAACKVFWFDEVKRQVLMPQARADIAQARAERPGMVAADVAEALYVYYAETDYPRALTIVDRALAVDGNDVEALNVRGNLLRRLGRRDEAIAASQRALALDPANPNSVEQVVDKLAFYGRHREAIAVIDAALPRLPADAHLPLKFYRAYLVFLVSGDRPVYLAALQSLEHETPRALWEPYWYNAVDPSPASVAYLASRSDSTIESLLQAAVSADHIGDAASRDRALDQIDRLKAAISSPSIRPITLVSDAVRLALRSDHDGTVTAVTTAIARLDAIGDEGDIGWAMIYGAYALARVGEKERALTLIERRLTVGHVPNADDYHNVVLAKLLGDEPRYQAVMEQIEAKFEKP